MKSKVQTPMVRDIGDPESLIEHRWGRAIEEWFAGRPGSLSAEIQNPAVKIHHSPANSSSTSSRVPSNYR